MCGIAAYVGKDPAAPFLFEAIKRLEYRGYDSWGVALMDDDGMVISRRAVGRPPEEKKFPPDTVGIAHTRWATNGAVTEANAHPIPGGYQVCDDKTAKDFVWVVHNGVITNYASLRNQLEQDGYLFRSSTDTEVISHLIAYYTRRGWDERAVLSKTCARLEGYFAFVALNESHPHSLLMASRGSPLFVSESGYVASDIAALAGYTDKAWKVEQSHLVIFQNGGRPQFARWIVDGYSYARPSPTSVTVPPAGISDIGNYPHYMLKEIHEQGIVVGNRRDWVDLKRPSQVVLVGCGSSYNACMLGRLYIEQMAWLSATAEYASEFTKRRVEMCRDDTLFVVVTQSGETRDTLSAIDYITHDGKGKNLLVLTNVEGSAADDSSDRTVYLGAGPEKGVAATKTFTATCMALLELSCLLARKGHDGHNHSSDLKEAIELLRLDLSVAIKKILTPLFGEKVLKTVEKLVVYDRVLFLAKGMLYPAAREGALKLKEVSYIHAEAIPAGEMKHGPIALIDNDTASVFLVTSGLGGGAVDARVLTNMQEIKARNGFVLAVADEKTAPAVNGLADCHLVMPTVPAVAQPILASVVLQLVAYHAAVMLGKDVDRPRHLAKAVSVE